MLALFTTSCTNQEAPIVSHGASMYDSPLIVEHQAMNNPYELSLELNPGNVVNDYSLIASMKLFGGSFYVSPFATGDFSGKFTLEIEQNNHLKLGQEIIETPPSREVFDPHPFVNGKVNWVQENTTYNYQVSVTSLQDFKVTGWVRFTIEPKCTYEEIPFDVVSKDGKVWVQQYPKLDKTTCKEANQPLQN